MRTLRTTTYTYLHTQSSKIATAFTMSSPAAEPITDAPADAPSQPKPRRTLFKNRKPKVVKTAEEEAVDAVDFFSRSKEVFPKAIQERREKREREERKKREEEAAKNQRMEEEAKRNLEIQEERKQRRFLLDKEDLGGSGDEFNAEGRATRSKSSSYRYDASLLYSFQAQKTHGILEKRR